MKFLLLCTVIVSAVIAEESVEVQVQNANTQFALQFYKALMKYKTGENIFFSPLGVHTVLSMLYQAAEGSTKDALTSALHVQNPQSDAEGYENILSNLNSIENVTLHIANKIYVQEGYSLLSDYKNTIETKFHSNVENLNFKQSDAAANEINSWVKDKTRGKISDLATPEDFNEDTATVILNTIYFKGEWRRKFPATKTGTFYIDKDTKLDVQMMEAFGKYMKKNDSDLNAQVVELPFQSAGVSLYIVLPFEKDGINELENRIQEHGLEKVFTGLLLHDNYHVVLPKFKLETVVDLEEPFNELGLGILFDPSKCNLRKMIAGSELLAVSKAVTKATIEVNEEGAEVSSATSSHQVFVDTAEPEYFYADHPFLVILKEGNNVLFFGKIMKPVYEQQI